MHTFRCLVNVRKNLTNLKKVLRQNTADVKKYCNYVYFYRVLHSLFGQRLKRLVLAQVTAGMDKQPA